MLQGWVDPTAHAGCRGELAGKEAAGLGNAGLFRVVIVEAPTGWTPDSEFSVPPAATVFELVDEPGPYPVSFVRHYNSAVLRWGGKTWAGLTRGESLVGERVELVGLGRLTQ